MPEDIEPYGPQISEDPDEECDEKIDALADIRRELETIEEESQRRV